MRQRSAPWFSAAVLALAASLGPGEATAQAVCSNEPGTGQRIVCKEPATSGKDIDIDVDGRTIAATGDRARGIDIAHSGSGNIDIDAKRLTVTTTGNLAPGIDGYHEGAGDLDIRASDIDVTTEGRSAHGVIGYHNGTAGDIDIDVRGGSRIETAGVRASGVLGYFGKGAGDVDIDVRDSAIETTGAEHANGVYGVHTGTGAIRIDVWDSAIETTGANSYGILGWHLPGASGDVDVDVRGGAIVTTGAVGNGIYVRHQNTGNVAIRAKNLTIATEGSDAKGILGRHQSAGDIVIDAEGVRIATKGEHAYGIMGFHSDSDSVGDIAIGVRNVRIATEGRYGIGVIGLFADDDGVGDIGISLGNVRIATMGELARGVFGHHIGTGGVAIDVQGGSIETTGSLARGVFGLHQGSTGDIAIGVRGVRIATTGASAHGIYAYHEGAGVIGIDVRSGSIETTAPQTHGIFGSHRGAAGDDNDIAIRLRGGRVATQGNGAYGVFGQQQGTGNVTIDTTGGSIRTTGDSAHGIYVLHDTGNGRISIDAGRVSARGKDASGVRAKGDRGTGDYRMQAVVEKQTVIASGPVYGGSGREAAGIHLEGGGTVVVGPRGSVGANSGIAVLATETFDAEFNAIAPTLNVDMILAGRRVRSVLGDNYILNVNDWDDDAGGRTSVAVNGVTLYDGVTGVTGRTVANGAWDVSLKGAGVTVKRGNDRNDWIVTDLAGGAVAGRDFSADDFIEVYAPRAAVYEAMPGALLRLDGGAGAAGRARTQGSLLWLQHGSATGSFRPRRAAVGATYRFDRFAAEVGMDFRLADSVTGSLAARLVSGSARVSAPTGGGRIDAMGYGLSFGVAWRGGNGFYGDGRVAATWYDVDLKSASRGDLEEGAGAIVHSLALEAGRRFAVNRRMRLTAQAWLNGAGVSLNRFTDAVGARVSIADSNEFRAGAGAVVETDLALNGGKDKLSLRGSLGAERMLVGGETTVRVSGETLKSRAPHSRAVLGLGATYRRGRGALSGGIRAHGLGSGDVAYIGRLDLRVAF